MQEPSKFCPRCNTQNYEGAMFCYSCSFKFPDEEYQRDRRRRGATFIGGLAIVLALLGLGIYWMMSSREPLPADRARSSSAPTPVPTSTPAPTPDLPTSELLSRAKTLLAQPYDKSKYDGAMDLLNRIPPAAKEYKDSIPLKQKITNAREREMVAA